MKQKGLTKLVPIAYGHATACKDEGARTGRGYYETVNDRVRLYPAARDFMRSMCAAFPALLDDGLDLDPHDLTAWLNDRMQDKTLRAIAAPVWNTARLMVCRDCFDVVAGNTDNIDADREGEIMTALDRMAGTVSTGDADQDQEFSRRPCELCGSSLGGSRHEIINLTKGGE